MSYYEDITSRFFTDLMKMRNEFEFLTRWRNSGAQSLWTCRDGHKVKICDMTEEHLNNTIKMLQRKASDSEALRYMLIEKRYRTNYNSLKSQITYCEKVADVVF